MKTYLIMELDALLVKKNKKSTDIVRATKHTPANVSKLRNGKMKSMRLKTLKDICDELDCQPGDIIKLVTEEELDQLLKDRGKAAANRKKVGIDRPVEPEKTYIIDLDDEN